MFDVEPKLVTGSSQVSIRVANASLDYENPNQRKFIVLVIAEETETKEKLSSTATLTVTVTDANDNRPTFDQESYSFSVSETAPSHQLIASITAKDLDSGRFGTAGIRYSLSGTGSELFDVDDVTGVITVADCPRGSAHSSSTENHRFRRQAADETDTNGKKVNLTIVSQTGLIDIGDPISTENYYPFTSSDEEETSAPVYHTDNDYLLFTGEGDEEYGSRQQTQPTPTGSSEAAVGNSAERSHVEPSQSGVGRAPCLDFETQSVYFLSFKVTFSIVNSVLLIFIY